MQRFIRAQTHQKLIWIVVRPELLNQRRHSAQRRERHIQKSARRTQARSNFTHNVARRLFVAIARIYRRRLQITAPLFIRPELQLSLAPALVPYVYRIYQARNTACHNHGIPVYQVSVYATVRELFCNRSNQFSLQRVANRLRVRPDYPAAYLFLPARNVRSRLYSVPFKPLWIIPR